MNLTRVSASLTALAAIATLAACGGGGGGGGSVTPPGNTGGGGTPPTMAPTAAPTNSPTTAPTNPPVGTSSTTVSAEENWVNGDTSWYTGGTASWTNHAGDTKTGAQGQSMDGVSCTQMGEPTNQYHVHAYVGLYVNGKWEAIPQAIGMKNPVEPMKSGHPSDTYEVESASCLYQIHTHDYSGLIHIEDSTKTQDPTWKTLMPYATLQTLFDEWGEPITATGVAGFQGPVSIYTGTPSGQVNRNDIVTSYTLSTAAPGSITLGHHEAVWIVVGTPPAGGLPKVQFVIQN